MQITLKFWILQGWILGKTTFKSAVIEHNELIK